MPPAAAGLQLNACRKPACDNFAVPPIEGVGRWSNPDIKDRYIVIGTANSERGRRSLQCRSCKETTALVSNHAVAEERDRLLALMALPPAGACNTDQCTNHGRDVRDAPDAYQSYGRTRIGSQRYRCRECGTTFSRSTAVTHRLRRPQKTVEIFRYLINRVAMRRLCEIAEIRPATLYQRIALIYERCRAFAAHHERPLLDGKALERVHLAIDRQEHMLNWGSALDRRPSLLMATASAEAKSGYIVAQHLNFDPDVDTFAIELAAREAGDPDTPPAFRRYARLWLPHERLEEPDAPADDPDVPTSAEFRPASRGAMVHDNIALLAHFQVLQRMLGGSGYIQLSMDRESGIERAATVTFADRIRAGTLDAFLVRINKDLTVAAKRQAVADAEVALAAERLRHPGTPEIELILRTIDARYRKAVAICPSAKDRWVAHPYPTMNEPERAMLCLTDDGGRPMKQLQWGFARASLRSIDRYFMQVRRKIHLLERPIQSASSGRRTFYAYSPYSAIVVMQLLEIFRVTYNFHLVGQQKTTPAQRFGLTDRVWSLDALIEFAPT